MASAAGPSREDFRDEDSILGDDLIEADDGLSASSAPPRLLRIVSLLY